MKWLRGLYRSLFPESIRLFVHRNLKPTRAFRHALAEDQRWVTEAKTHYVKWELEASLECVSKALLANPESQKALQMRGQILLVMGRHDEAHKAANCLLEKFPIDKQGRKQLSSLGVSPPPASKEIALSFALSKGGRPSLYAQGAQYLYDAGMFEDALELCSVGFAAYLTDGGRKPRSTTADDLLKVKADSIEAMHRYQEAIAVFEELLPRASSQARGAAGIARCLFELGEFSQAEAILLKANSRGTDPMPWSPLLLDILQAQGKIRASYNLYRKKPISGAIADYFGMGAPREINLCSGDYRHKKALLLSEGGPGDELRLCSVYLELRELFGELCVSSDPRLVEVMRRTFPEIEFLPVGRYRAEVARDMTDRQQVGDSRIIQCVSNDAVSYGRSVDFVASVLDTLADVRPHRESFHSAHRRALVPLPHLKEHWKQVIGNSRRLQVGIAWRSMLETVARDRHYFPVHVLAAFAPFEDVDFWLLQPRIRDEELKHLQSLVSLRIPEGLDLINDMEGQLALTSCLDVVISPFTATGELAAAAGVTTILVSGSRSTLWRRNDDGSDIFASNAQIVCGEPVHDKVAAITSAARALSDVQQSHNGAKLSRFEADAASIQI